MKKSDFLLIGVVLLIVVVALFSTKGNEELEEVNYPLALSGEVGLHQLTYSEYEEKVDSGEAFIVVIERDGCGYCTMYMPIVKEVADEKSVPIYFIDLADESSENVSKLTSTNKYLKRNPEWGTPTTLFMLGDRVLDSIGGYVEKDGILSFLDGKVVMGE